MPISVDDVRQTLAEVTIDQITDATIRQSIKLARTKIRLMVRPNVQISDQESAEQMYAAFLAYQFYVTKVVKQLGSLPLEVRDTLAILRRTAEEYINEIKWDKKGKSVLAVTTGVEGEYYGSD